MNEKSLLIVCGGESAEHEVSIRSARNILAALDRKKYRPTIVGISKSGTWYLIPDETYLMSHDKFTDTETGNLTVVGLIKKQNRCYLNSFDGKISTAIDVAFPILHGTNGEDGTIQGLFKISGLPFVGCGVLSSALCMDKEIMKNTLTQSGVQNAKFEVIRKHDSGAPSLTFAQLKDSLGLPFFIKPANAGSSVGVHKIKSEADYQEKIIDSMKYDFKIIAEEFIAGRELEISVMGLNESPRSAVPGEVIPKHEFYSYEAKYIDADGAKIIIPADLPANVIAEMKKISERAFTVCCCNGLARVDFFLRNDGTLFLNELNTLPGFTSISMYPKMWEAAGIGYSRLISELIELAFARFQKDSELTTEFL